MYHLESHEAILFSQYKGVRSEIRAISVKSAEASKQRTDQHLSAARIQRFYRFTRLMVTFKAYGWVETPESPEAKLRHGRTIRDNIFKADPVESVENPFP